MSKTVLNTKIIKKHRNLSLTNIMTNIKNHKTCNFEQNMSERW